LKDVFQDNKLFLNFISEVVNIRLTFYIADQQAEVIVKKNNTLDSLSVVAKNYKETIDSQISIIEQQKKSNEISALQLTGLNKKIDSLKTILFKLDNVTIGKQTWKKENVKTSFFNNGDAIYEAKTPQQWEVFCKSKTPCFMCLPNGEYLYNGYVLADKRGIAPEGYFIPSNEDFLSLINFLSIRAKSKKNAVQQMLNYDWWEETEDYENGGITDTTYYSNNYSGFNGRPAGFVSPSGGLTGYLLRNDSGTEDINGTENYTNAEPFGNCSFYWTSTISNESDELENAYNCYDEENDNYQFYNGIDFGYCSQDEGGSVQENELSFLKYCSNYGFSIRFIKK
jgi:uncharacterized protein (TIGR02145 family)